MLLAFLAVAGERREAIVLFTNDSHGHVCNDGANDVRFSSVCALRRDLALRGKSVFAVDAGDFLQGAPYAAVDRGEGVVDILNAAGYDAVTLGNHEFDYGWDVLSNRLARLRCPAVSCNLWRSNTVSRTEEPVLPASVVLTNCGVSVAFVGVSTPETASAACPGAFCDAAMNRTMGFWGEGPCLDALVRAVQGAVDGARARATPDYVVLLGHLGCETAQAPLRSTDVIPRLRGVDAFIDGHSHTVMASHGLRDADGRSVALGQTGCYLRNVGVLSLSPSGSRCEIRRAPGLRDAAVYAVETAHVAKVERLLGATVARSAVRLAAVDGVCDWLVRRHETNAGDFVADAYYWAANRTDATRADAALVNGGGVRANLAPGVVRRLDLVSMNPFGNEVVVVRISGARTVELLEHAVRLAPNEASGSFPQVAGMRFAVVREDGCNRVRELERYDRATGEWKPVMPTDEVRLALSSFQADGGSGAETMRRAPREAVVGGDCGILTDYLSSFACADGDGLPSLCSAGSPLAALPGYGIDYESPRGAERVRLPADGQEGGER